MSGFPSTGVHLHCPTSDKSVVVNRGSASLVPPFTIWSAQSEEPLRMVWRQSNNHKTRFRDRPLERLNRGCVSVLVAASEPSNARRLRSVLWPTRTTTVCDPKTSFGQRLRAASTAGKPTVSAELRSGTHPRSRLDTCSDTGRLVCAAQVQCSTPLRSPRRHLAGDGSSDGHPMSVVSSGDDRDQLLRPPRNRRP